jgi:hypothetical protein
MFGITQGCFKLDVFKPTVIMPSAIMLIVIAPKNQFLPSVLYFCQTWRRLGPTIRKLGRFISQRR